MLNDKSLNICESAQLLQLGRTFVVNVVIPRLSGCGSNEMKSSIVSCMMFLTSIVTVSSSTATQQSSWKTCFTWRGHDVARTVISKALRSEWRWSWRTMANVAAFAAGCLSLGAVDRSCLPTIKCHCVGLTRCNCYLSRMFRVIWVVHLSVIWRSRERARDRIEVNDSHIH